MDNATLNIINYHPKYFKSFWLPSNSAMISKVTVEMDIFWSVVMGSNAEIEIVPSLNTEDEEYYETFLEHQETLHINQYFAQDATWLQQQISSGTFVVGRDEKFMLSLARAEEPWGNTNAHLFYDETLQNTILRVLISHYRQVDARSAFRVSGSLNLIDGDQADFLRHLLSETSLYDIFIQLLNGQYLVCIGFWYPETNDRNIIEFLRYSRSKN